ncbi:hypothetical protein ACQ4PT_003108 [Festuca glaucescens]
MPSRSRCGRGGGDADDDDDYEVVTVSSDPDESESEPERGADADDDDEYVADSSDGGGVEDEAEEGGDSYNGDGGRLLRGGRRGVEEPDEERKSQNVDALVRLGKTLQSITLLYTLLAQGFDGKPMVKRAVIVTPTSLVSNWEAEISKWLKGKVHLLALCESTRADVLSGIGSFLKPLSRLQVLIISYETFRMHSSKFEIPGSCDLLICDEAHRLKNDQTLTNKIVEVVCCKLSPLQMTLYNHFIHSKNVKRLISEQAKQSKVLAYITALKKLCNHPKVYQRQMSKEGLQKVIQQEQASDKMQDQGNSLSTEDLRDLFTFHEQVRSEIHENLKCNRCNKNDHMLLDANGSNLAATEHSTVSTSTERIYTDIGGFGEISGCVQKMNSSNQQIEQPSEEDLGSWGHHSDPSTVPDTILQCSAGDEVSFVFTNQIDGKLVPVESMVRLTTHQPNGMTASGQKEVPKINSPRKPGRQSLLGKNLKMMGFNLKNSSLKCPTKSKRPSPICLQTLNKTNPSSVQQPQNKRLHVASDISDDDFV